MAYCSIWFKLYRLFQFDLLKDVDNILPSVRTSVCSLDHFILWSAKAVIPYGSFSLVGEIFLKALRRQGSSLCLRSLLLSLRFCLIVAQFLIDLHGTPLEGYVKTAADPECSGPFHYQGLATGNLLLPFCNYCSCFQIQRKVLVPAFSASMI